MTSSRSQEGSMTSSRLYCCACSIVDTTTNNTLRRVTTVEILCRANCITNQAPTHHCLLRYSNPLTLLLKHYVRYDVCCRITLQGDVESLYRVTCIVHQVSTPHNCLLRYSNSYDRATRSTLAVWSSRPDPERKDALHHELHLNVWERRSSSEENKKEG